MNQKRQDARDARVPRDETFMAIAEVIAARGTCDRLRVGAVIVVDDRVIATGYNGAPKGWDDCDFVGHDLVTIGDKESCQRTLHAEHNAVLQCANYGVSPTGGTLYCTASPCKDCLKMLAQVGIKRIVYQGEYTGGRNSGKETVPELAKRYGIFLEKT